MVTLDSIWRSFMATDEKWKYFHIRQIFVLLNNLDAGNIKIDLGVLRNEPYYLKAIDEAREISSFYGKQFISNAYVALKLFFSSIRYDQNSEMVTYNKDHLLVFLLNMQSFFENGMVFSEDKKELLEKEFVEMVQNRGGIF